MHTGKIVKVTSKPKGFVLRVPAVPPETEPTDYTFAPVDADDHAVALAAYTNGHDADVDGTPPACAGVTAR